MVRLVTRALNGAVIRQLSSEIAAIVARPDVQAKIATLSVEPDYADEATGNILSYRYIGVNPTNNQEEDITSHRLTIVETEWKYFTENPVFGIGPGMEKVLPMENSKVHAGHCTLAERIVVTRILRHFDKYYTFNNYIYISDAGGSVFNRNTEPKLKKPNRIDVILKNGTFSISV